MSKYVNQCQTISWPGRILLVNCYFSSILRLCKSLSWQFLAHNLGVHIIFRCWEIKQGLCSWQVFRPPRTLRNFSVSTNAVVKSHTKLCKKLRLCSDRKSSCVCRTRWRFSWCLGFLRQSLYKEWGYHCRQTFLSGPTKNSASSARAQHPAYAPGALVDYPTLSNSFKNGTSATLSWTDSPCPLLDSSGYGRANVCFVLQLLEHPLQIVPAKAVQSRNPPLRCLTRHSYCTQQSQHKPSKASKASKASKEPSLPGFWGFSWLRQEPTQLLTGIPSTPAAACQKVRHRH